MTSEKQTELLNALNKFFNREYGKTYNSLSDFIGEDGLIAIAYTEYDDDDDHGDCTVQVSYDLATEEYVHICGYEYGEREYRQAVTLDYFIKDLKVCNFEDFLVFDKK